MRFWVLGTIQHLLPNTCHITPNPFVSMPKLAYLECPTGIAGDMCLGAIADAGVPLDYLT